MDPNAAVLFNLLGGLALFLFGMNSMSDSLQKAAGDRMRAILGFLTRNPVMGVLAGALVTAVLQSSSATTVMVVGFVSAGLMTLKQGISVIFGANIGTTITAQIIAFKLSDYIMPIIVIGFLIFFIFRKENIKNIGMGIFSFGVLFLGIETMGAAMKPLASSPFFIDLISQVSNMPILGLGVGTLMTLVVQSSSATIAVLQNFASQPASDGVSAAMSLGSAIPILLGDNIGTTITALIASIGQSKDAKRCAIAHTVFNLTGAFIFMLLTPFVVPIVQSLTPGNEIDVISRQIANTHTLFNICNTIIWLPLLPVMVKIVKTIIPGKDRGENGEILPHFLNQSVINQPVAAMHLLSQELQRSAGLVSEMLDKTRSALTGPGRTSLIAEVKEQGHEIGELHRHVSAYISALLSGTAITEAQSEQLASLLIVNNNISRVSERCIEIVDIASKQPGGKMSFSEEGKAEVSALFDELEAVFNNTLTALIQQDKGLAETVLKDMNKLHKLIKKSNKNHLKRLNAKDCPDALGNAYPAVLYAVSRIGDSCYGLAEEVLEDVELAAIDI